MVLVSARKVFKKISCLCTFKHPLGFNFSEFVLTGWSRDTETGDPARLTAKVAERSGLKKVKKGAAR
jgi:hypothetical protein